MEIKFYSPSYKRSNSVKVNKWLDTVILCVHEFEVDEYRKYNKNDIMVMPNKLKGNMGKVRNYILNNSKCDICVMLDDDVEYIGYYENLESNIVSQGDLYYKILEWGEQAKSLGTVLFGINLQSDPKFYREYCPISFKSAVLGTFCCIIKKDNDIKYDIKLGLNEDYDYCLQVLVKYHKVLRWNKYHYKAGHLDQPGGCGSYRVIENEIKQSKLMIKKWGKLVKYNLEKSTNPIIKSPYKGI